MSLDVRPAALPVPRLYDAVAGRSAAVVIELYSSSFGLASRLLREPVRSDVRNVYALVRIADEVVDCPDIGVPDSARRELLDRLEEETRHAMEVGYSSNLVVHAFAMTARRCGIDDALTAPFFDSMRTDLVRTVHDPESFDRYVYGSAEVVGLMCLRVFLAGGDARGPGHRFDDLAPGARRLGAAFQKLNFLRDIADDRRLLGRSYFPGVDVETLDEDQRDRILDDIWDDLDVASDAIPALPASSRRAVLAAYALFSRLASELSVTPAAAIRAGRISLSPVTKIRVAGAALLRGGGA